MLILLDQDGVLADFERGFVDAWRTRFPERRWVAVEDRRTFYVRDDYPAELRADVESIYHSAGFYRSLPVIPGAVAAVEELQSLGHDVRICSAPLTAYRHCVAEKFEWVEKHFGAEFVDRLVLTKDKTLVRGDVLVDDRPAVLGALNPTWRHVVFDQPYNRDALGARLDWNNWSLLA